MQQSHSHLPKRIATMHEHIIAFVIAFFVVAGIGWIVMYRDTLFADITRATWAKNIQITSPIVYSVQNGSLSIKTTQQFVDAASMTFFVVFDPKKVLLQLEKAQSKYTYTYAPGMDTMVQVTVFSKGTIQAWETIYSVPMNGTVEDVTIANAGVLRQNDRFETVAIHKE